MLTASLGRLAGFAMPQSEAILQLVGVVFGVDPWTIGRTTASIGIADLGEARRLAASGLA